MVDENSNQSSPSYVLFVWSSAGWTLQQHDGEAPAPGSMVEAGETLLRVSKVGPSPLPGDRRRCAYTELV